MSSNASTKTGHIYKKESFWSAARADIARNKFAYMLAIPVIAFYIIFCYGPMYGLIIAFKDFSPRLGILKSQWVGFEHFIEFFKSYYFGRLINNTVLISLYDIIFGFPASIILALLLNEVSNRFFKKTIQTISYLPHFISLVVICSMIVTFTSSEGVINDLIVFFGGERGSLLMKPELFKGLFVGSGIWQGVGWGSIIYLAALSGVDQELYEAAEIDGANRWQQTLHVTLPSIASTIVILLILRVGGLMSVGYEKIILLSNPTNVESAEVISSYVYKKGLLNFEYSYSTAIGLFNSIINFVLVILTNKISKKFSEISLW